MTCTATEGPAAECPYRAAPTVAEAAKVLLKADDKQGPYGSCGGQHWVPGMWFVLRALAGEGQR